jgi:bifunctional UDP-N-acetylglucosamine pyrophosphorylase/glucosamine-1-phosphate N-acetyltransferase
MYGDIFVSKEVVQKLLNYNLREKKNCGVIAAKEVKDPEIYGCLEISADELVHIWEKKPNPPSNYINAGLMILPKSIFKHLEATKKSERGEVELTDGINESIRENTTYYVFKIEDYWIDTGYPWDLLSANLIGLNNLLPNDEFSTPAGVTIEGQVRIASSAILRPGTFIQGPVMIEENCVVGPSCYIRSGTYLGNGVRIGNGVEIKNSIILDKTIIGHLSYVGDSIISRNCNFGAGTKVANLRFDDGNISMEIKNIIINSNRRKFGIVMGENVKTGINVSIMPGISIGENSRIGAHTLVTKNLPPNSLLFYHPEEGRVVLKENLYG